MSGFKVAHVFDLRKKVPLTMGALLGLLSAACWGVGDFSGGMGVKAAGGSPRAALRLVVLSHLTSIGVLLALALAFGGPFPAHPLLAWGVAAGILAGLSLSAFYVALSRGAMGASAAVSGLLAAAIPAIVSSFLDGRAGPQRYLGFLVAGAAIWLIAAGQGVREQRGTTVLATAAGAGFGLYFVALHFAGAGGVLWAMTTARLGSIATCATILLAMSLTPSKGGPARITRHVVGWMLATALFDTSGNLLFVAATRAGRLDVAAVLASLYPASTILLAGFVLHEKLTPRQKWGMAIAVCAVALITLK